MYTFLISIVLLILGYVIYSRVVERFFVIDEKATTPAISKTDGVDYVPMPAWRIFLVQFLNIAGLGPIFGAIMGIFFGPSAFLWIVFGSIFAGGVHDYLSGMMSLRKGGLSLPGLIGSELGNAVKTFINILSLVLLILLTTTFLSGPAGLLQQMFPFAQISYHGHFLPLGWIAVIFVYYCLATVLPIDKLIGRFYPLFGGVLLVMGVSIMVVMLFSHSGDMLELSSGLYNRRGDAYPLFPMMFVSIACGAISGFHGTQSPLMARCLTNERQGRIIFYGAMISEGILALIWAAATATFFADPSTGLSGLEGLQLFAQEHPNENIATLVIDIISRTWLGKIGSVLVVLGVIMAPITSGDTALRSARLILAEFFSIPQKLKRNRILIAFPLWIFVFIMIFVNFDVVWRYFAWTNQTLAVFTLWAATVFLYKNSNTSPIKRGGATFSYLIALLPALFMTAVSVSYIIVAPEGFGLASKGLTHVGYITAAIVCVGVLALFVYKTKSIKNKYRSFPN